MPTDNLDPMTAPDDDLDHPAPDEPAPDELAPDELAEPVRAGNPRVDAVLDSLEDLQDLPVSEHVAVFERAHEELRRALDADPDA